MKQAANRYPSDRWPSIRRLLRASIIQRILERLVEMCTLITYYYAVLKDDRVESLVSFYFFIVVRFSVSVDDGWLAMCVLNNISLCHSCLRNKISIDGHFLAIPPYSPLWLLLQEHRHSNAPSLCPVFAFPDPSKRGPPPWSSTKWGPCQTTLPS